MTGKCEVKFEVKRLRLFQRRLRDWQKTVIKIGPSTAPRSDPLRIGTNAYTNAEIGRIHELNLYHYGFRSFLKFPIQQDFAYRVVQMKARIDDPYVLFDHKENFPEMLGEIALKSVDIAFATDGWGAWQPLRVNTIIKKEKIKSPTPDKLLEESGSQLRNSITWEFA